MSNRPSVSESEGDRKGARTIRIFARAVVAIATNFSGEQVERYVERIYSVTPEVKKRLEFLFKKRETS